MKVALVHDYLVQAGGAERVVAALHRLFPEAPIFTTVSDPTLVATLLPGADVRTSWMQPLPGVRRHFRTYVLCYPAAIERLDLRGFDLVISSSSAFAKGALADPGARHICYCHTPMRFVWNLPDYIARERWGPLLRPFLPVVLAPLRRWDLATAGRPGTYLANSSVVAARIARIYHRDAQVVPPPVDVDRFQPQSGPGEYFLVVSRLVGYKRVDLAVDAMSRLGRTLLIIGDGPARGALERRAGPTVHFLGRLPDVDVAQYLAGCRALLFPGEEDFGITPLEANAAGRPVIAFRAGGALDTVVAGRTGVFFEAQTPEALADAVREADTLAWDSSVLRRHAEGYGEDVFRRRILDVVRGEAGMEAPAAPLEAAG